tara:strand:- start:89 stop:820 length:732 start_codon:yes stop_codon:yes gene_type:complete
MRALVIGETCNDIFCYGESERMCPAAPAPVFTPVKIIKSPGMAMNVQKNIISLGLECDIVTNSNWGEITKTRYVHQNTNHFFIRIDKGDGDFYRCNIDEIDFSKYDIIVISDYDKGFLHREDISKISNEHACVFMDTKKELGQWCNSIKYIKINNFEYERSKNSIDENIKAKIIATMGRKGCTHAGITYPVDEVEIKDLSGAGDTFLAGLVVEYARTKSIEKSVTFANVCATKVVQKKGVSVV